ncbi:MAG: glycerol-3-phosphate dehydrogenase/oxidase [Cognaticolwellia sp.]
MDNVSKPEEKLGSATDGITLAKNVLMTRAQRIADIENSASWDLVIIGGGITGAGILKLASQMGLKVLLLEQKDFAWGSSSRSSKMVHGGLRYMAQGQVALTRESVIERQRLLTDGQPLVQKQSFTLSHYKKAFPGPWVFNRLLSCYDFIAGVKQHQFWPKSSYLALAPQVDEHDLLGGTQFFDALTEDARLVQRLIQESLQLGGQALNYAKVVGLSGQENRHQIDLQLEEQTTAITFNAKVVINACGAWSNLLNVEANNGKTAEQSTNHSAKKTAYKMRPLRGSHLVIPSWRLPVASVISVQHAQDKRPVQVYPWQNVTIVGTTDVEHHEDMALEAKISQQEFDYLLATIKQQFPHANITADDIISTFSGVRPVTTSGESLAPSKEKREHHIEQNQGLISVTGGKLTTFRLIAEQVMTKVCQQLGEDDTLDQEVLKQTLSFACQQPIFSQVQVSNMETSKANGEHDSVLTFSADIQQQIQACYGEFSQIFVKANNKEDCSPIRYSKHLWAELIWAVRFEQIQHLDDLLLRRTRLGNVLPEGARELLPKIKTLCSPYLSWSEEKWQQEISRYLALWQKSYSLPNDTK